MDAIGMQAAADFPGELHVPVGAFVFDLAAHLDVNRGDQLGIAELPHVQMVRADNAADAVDVFLDVVDAHSGGHGLQKDPGGGLAERNRRAQDDDGDDQRNAGVDVVSPRVISQPDNQGGGNNSNVSKSVAQYV